MARQVDLTDEEAQFLRTLLDWWHEGFKDAKDATIQDHNLDMDDLLILTDSLAEDEKTVQTIMEKLG
jgi:hypothetical protein